MCADGATRAEVADASLPSINEKATPNSLGVAMTGARGRNRTGTPFGEGFSYHFDFSRHTADTECLWSGARLHHSLVALGARRLLSTPSQTLGLGSALARLQQQSGRSPNLTGFTSGVSPEGSNCSSPLCLPISPLGRYAYYTRKLSFLRPMCVPQQELRNRHSCPKLLAACVVD